MKALVGQIFQETNSFNTLITKEEHFTVYRGPQILPAMTGTGSILGGIINGLRDNHIEIIPSIAAFALPGGPVQHSVFETYLNELLLVAQQSNPDIVVLDLHGAMNTTECDDPEGEILDRLRSVLNSNCVIGIGLDLHGHVTDKMLNNADIVTACKHNPHSDYFEAGERAAQLCIRKSKGEISPVTIYAQIPLLLEANKMTDTGPLKAVHEKAINYLKSHSQLLDISIFNTFPLMDVPDMGQMVIVISDNYDPLSEKICIELCSYLWEHRKVFKNTFQSVPAALSQIIETLDQGPFIMADYGDQILAGAPGDNVEILEALLSCETKVRAVLPLTDPTAVQKARAAGIGSEITMFVGAAYTKDIKPIEITAIVENFTDGIFKLAGPFCAGLISSHGDTAVIRAGTIRVIVTSRPPCTQDVNFYISSGIRFEEQDLIVVKSGQHFRMSFEGIGKPVWVNTKGIGAYLGGAFEVSREPVYPEADIELGTIQVKKVA